MSDDQQPVRPRGAAEPLPTWQPQPVQAPAPPYGAPDAQVPGPYAAPDQSPYAAPPRSPSQNPYGQTPGATGTYAQGPPVPMSPYAPTPAYAQDAYGQPTQPQTPLAPQADGPSRFGSYAPSGTYGSRDPAYAPGGFGGGGYAGGGYAAGGYSPQPGYGYGYTAQPALASWGSRVAALLIDVAPVMLLLLVAGVASAFLSTPGYDVYGQPVREPTGAGVLLGLGAYVAGFGFQIWNRYVRQGRTGQSLGKQALGIRLVKEQTMGPTGAGLAFGREIAHNVDSLILYIGYLWPLWDPKGQTLADKICSTLVIKG